MKARNKVRDLNNIGGNKSTGVVLPRPPAECFDDYVDETKKRFEERKPEKIHRSRERPSY